MRLSICIPTLNRASVIGATLDSILEQIQDDVEVVIVDGGSRDGTAEVVALRATRCPRIRYHPTPHLASGAAMPSNVGFSQDCDHALELARGRYCWILPDDDLVAPGGIGRLLGYLDRGVALIVANAQVRSTDMGTVLKPRLIGLDQDRVFARGQADGILACAGAYLSYAGGVVVRRDWWMASERKSHYSSSFFHIWALFQKPAELDAVVIAEPLIWLRYGNAQWVKRGFEIWMLNWPSQIWSLPLGDEAKAAVICREPWRRLSLIANYRARGWYGLAQYRQLLAQVRPPLRIRIGAAVVAMIPGWLLNLMAVAITVLRRGRHGTDFLDFWQSPNNLLARLSRRRAQRKPPPG
jgi:abequosyltransferase